MIVDEPVEKEPKVSFDCVCGCVVGVVVDDQ